MARKDTPERKRELELKDELERMIAQDTADLTTAVQQAKSILPSRSTSGFLDYENVKIESDSTAKNIVDSIAEFYLNKNIITEIPYVTQKNSVDKITVSNLLFQMKTAEHAIIKLLEEIDNGNTHPRTFEVLSSLQRSKMEIVKHLAQFMVIMEQNYKNLKEDYRIKIAEEPNALSGGEYTDVTDNGNPMQMRGTKGLMEMIREAVPEKRADATIKKETTDGENGDSLEH
jgi:hypothetical protein